MNEDFLLYVRATQKNKDFQSFVELVSSLEKDKSFNISYGVVQGRPFFTLGAPVPFNISDRLYATFINIFPESLHSKLLKVQTRESVDKFGEVLTPTHIIQKMCDIFPEEIWSDKDKKFFDPCAGTGGMPAIIMIRLMEGLSSIIYDKEERYKHIMEKQIFMAEYQRQSAREIEAIFNPDGIYKLNLYVGDTLRMPKNFWDLSYEKRVSWYPQHHISDDTPEDKIAYVEVTSEPLF